MRLPVAAALLLVIAALLAPLPAEARDGSVIVRCSPPGAEIVVDGSTVGVTPRTVAMPAGKHTIKLSLKGYLSESLTVAVKAGQSTKLYVLLTKKGVAGLHVRDGVGGAPPASLGLVVVVTEPAGLTVFINGERVTRPTPVAFDIGPGTYATTIKYQDVEVFSTSTVVTRGERVQVKHNLKKAVDAARAAARTGRPRGPGPDDARPADPPPDDSRRPPKCKCSARRKLKACVEKRRACKLGAPGGERAAAYALCYSCRQFRRLPRKRRPAAETACDTRTGRTDDCVCRDIRRVVTQCLRPQEACLRRCGGD